MCESAGIYLSLLPPEQLWRHCRIAAGQWPMRVVRERKYKLIWNIAHGLDFPFASDLWAASTWQATLRSGGKFYGKRTLEAYLHRPKFELYDLENDPWLLKWEYE